MFNNPYFNPAQTYMPNQRMDYMNQQLVNQQMNTQAYVPPVQAVKPAGLLGKSVDSIEVVKATDIPLDVSISYVPLTDGTAIVTKQLMMDGTSKTVVYKPVDDEKVEEVRYVTTEELEKTNNKIEDIKENIKDDIRELKQEFKEFRKSKKRDD